MVSPVGEKKLDLNGAVLNRRRQVLHRKQRQRRGCDLKPRLAARAKREADLQTGHCADAHQATLNPSQPFLGIWRVRQARVGGLVDQPPL